MKLLQVLTCLALCIFAQGQNHPDFISIDCGASSSYLDETLKIQYTTDEGYVDSGVNMKVLPSLSAFSVNLNQLMNVRAFPSGMRNCYTVWPRQGKNKRYLIRATFAYGNYDNNFQSPFFDLYIDVNLWAHLNPPIFYTYDEIIYTPVRDYIQVCLVNLGSGTPFISALELRLLDNSTYAVPSGALRMRWRENIGSNNLYRYPEDEYDRIWEGRIYNEYDVVTNTTNVDALNLNNGDYRVPTEVLMAAQQSRSGMNMYWSSNSTTYDWHMFLHFAELEMLQPGQFRQFIIQVNNNKTTVTPEYLKPMSVATLPFSEDSVRFSVTPSSESNVSAFINAVEIFQSLDLLNLPTHLNDAYAMLKIKKTYEVVKESWQGDPCVPKQFAWNGLTCSNDKIPRIVSLTLSSSGLEGNIADSFCNLTALTTLDLSSNQLTGEIPDFFAQMSNLTIINLSNNNLTGAIPQALQHRVDDKTLTLSVHGNPLCQNHTENCSLLPSPTERPCCTGLKRILVPLSIALGLIVGLTLISCIVFVIWRKRNKRNKAKLGKVNQSTMVSDQFNARSKVASWPEDNILESTDRNELQLQIVARNRPFTSQEICSITKKFTAVIGEGGFGEVYCGTLNDGKQVAVKVLSQSSNQGYKEFQAEAQLLMVVHHKNLVSLVGYCKDSETMALLYEYMSNGDLKKYLAGDGINILSWIWRLQIAIDAAQGLDYLHNGCTPPIIHRDMKTSNILLDEQMQAKIADFGLSRVFATDSAGNQISSTRPAGTPGYLDPLFNTDGNLSKKSDVYSFGIILFELITGQPAIIRNLQVNTHIVKWVTSLMDEEGDIERIVDPRIQGRFNIRSVEKAIEIAMQCVQILPVKRPEMNRVVFDLVECLSMETGLIKNQAEEGIISLESSSSIKTSSIKLDI